jgi:glucose-1-phosphate adenylyltransferase
LPATKAESCSLKEVLLAEGSIVVEAQIERSVIGIRSRIGRGAKISDSLILGADYFETWEEIERASGRAVPPIGIGDGTIIRRAIVDKNARIGRGVKILNEGRENHRDGDNHYIRDGIVVVPKNAVIHDGTVI